MQIIQVTIGTTSSEAELCSMSWRLGSCYLYEEVLPAPAVFFMYIMGRAYRGLFQDPNMIRFIPQEACGGGNLAVLESLDIEQQPSSVVQREGSVRAAAGGLAKVEGTGIVWDMEKFANIAQLSGRKLIFAFDGTFLNAHVSTAAVKIVNLVDSTSACASLNGGTYFRILVLLTLFIAHSYPWLGTCFLKIVKQTSHGLIAWPSKRILQAYLAMQRCLVIFIFALH